MLNSINVKFFETITSDSKRISQNDISAKCHICGDSKRGNKRRLHLFHRNGNDFIHCFNCEIHMSMKNFIKEFHPELLSDFKRETALDSIHNKGLNHLESNFQKPKKDKSKILTIHEFNDFFKPLSKESKEFLKSRRFSNEDIQRLFAVDGVDNCNLFGKCLNLSGFVIIPIFDKNFNVFGFQARAIKEKKFFTIILEGFEKVWGLHTLKPDGDIFVFESIFDAVSSGFNQTLAVMGIGSAMSLLSKYKGRAVVFFDNQNLDKASLKTCKELAKAGHRVVVWDDCSFKDVNDLREIITQENIQTLARENTLDGLSAFVRLSQIKL